MFKEIQQLDKSHECLKNQNQAKLVISSLLANLVGCPCSKVKAMNPVTVMAAGKPGSQGT